VSDKEPPISFILGLPFHQTTMAETLASCEFLIEKKQPAYIVTANADFVAQTHEDADLHLIVFHAERVVCDGMPLVWLSRLFGARLPERVAGSDMVFELFKLCQRRQWRIYFLGSDPATLKTATDYLTETYPGLKVAGSHSPPIAPVHEWANEEIIEDIRKTRPHLLLVAVGCPKQERWIYQHYQESGVPLSIGIGASLDFISGKQVRAPRWMQKTGMEWLWRIGTDPGRLAKRYWKDLRFLLILTIRQGRIVLFRPRRLWSTGSVSLEKAPESTGPEAVSDLDRIAWIGELSLANLDDFPLPKPSPAPRLVNLEGIRFIDSAGMGRLVALARQCRSAGVPCAFVAPSGHPFEKLVQQLHLAAVLPSFKTEASAVDWLTERWHRQQGTPAAQPKGGQRLELRGELDALTIEPVMASIRSALTEMPQQHILRLGASSVTFMDSFAIGQLLTAKKQALTDGKDVFLAEPSEPVVRILTLLKLDKLLIEP